MAMDRCDGAYAVEFNAKEIAGIANAVRSVPREMINADLINSMKPTSVLVNCARGALVDNDALRAALIEGRIACAALDVIEPEPTPGDHPLVDLPPEARHRAVYSSHLGGSSGGSFARAHLTMWENARRILNGERPVNVVNGI